VKGARDLCALDELEPGRLTELALPSGSSVVIVRTGDGVRVFSAVCPHRGGPLARGRVRPDVSSAPDCPRDRIVDRTRLLLTCPWHNWEFDLDAGGLALYDSRRVRVYESSVVDGRVLASVPA
jgi:3-phenylpropionate/trans-cinnamate dioxygenase ferredoxin subunit